MRTAFAIGRVVDAALAVIGRRFEATMTDAPGLPHFASGEVVKGFGRGSKQLGTPTANFPSDVVRLLPPDFKTGVYFGLAQVNDGPVHDMVMSVGYNPYFNNTEKSMETYIMHAFDSDFYGSNLKVIVLGFMRSQRADFKDIDELKAAIDKDIVDAGLALKDERFVGFRTHEFFGRS